MGNKSSNSATFAEWKYQSECQYSRSSQRVNEVRWLRVPVSSEFARGAVVAGRILVGAATLGLSELSRKKDLSHECLEILTTCKVCGENRRYTAEILGSGSKNTYFCCGYYSWKYDARKTWKPPSSMTLDYVERKYKEVGTSYRFAGNNCYHWCLRLWNKL